MMTASEVAAALNEAKSNGYDLSGWTVEDIVLDLLAYEAGAEEDTPENLRPHVVAWKDSIQ